jgi:hypothetical protein
MYKLNVKCCFNYVLIGRVVYFHMRSASGKTIVQAKTFSVVFVLAILRCGQVKKYTLVLCI